MLGKMKRSTIYLGRTKKIKGPRHSPKHVWNCFKDNIQNTSKRLGSETYVGFPKHVHIYHSKLSWTEPAISRVEKDIYWKCRQVKSSVQPLTECDVHTINGECKQNTDGVQPLTESENKTQGVSSQWLRAVSSHWLRVQTRLKWCPASDWEWKQDSSGVQPVTESGVQPLAESANKTRVVSSHWLRVQTRQEWCPATDWECKQDKSGVQPLTESANKTKVVSSHWLSVVSSHWLRVVSSHWLRVKTRQGWCPAIDWECVTESGVQPLTESGVQPLRESENKTSSVQPYVSTEVTEVGIFTACFCCFTDVVPWQCDIDWVITHSHKI